MADDGGVRLCAGPVSFCCQCGKCCPKSRGSLDACGKCRLVRYCSRECQVKHWPEHKFECKSFEQLLEGGADPEMIRLMRWRGCFGPALGVFALWFWVQIKERAERKSVRSSFELDSAGMRSNVFFAQSVRVPGQERVVQSLRSGPRVMRVVINATFPDQTSRCTFFAVDLDTILPTIWAYDLKNRKLGKAFENKWESRMRQAIRLGHDIAYFAQIVKTRFKIEQAGRTQNCVCIDDNRASEMMEEVLDIVSEDGLESVLLENAGLKYREINKLNAWSCKTGPSVKLSAKQSSRDDFTSLHSSFSSTFMERIDREDCIDLFSGALSFCEHCNLCVPKKQGKLDTCGRCKCVRYCSRQCQIAHWPIHKKLCRSPEQLAAEGHTAQEQRLAQWRDCWMQGLTAYALWSANLSRNTDPGYLLFHTYCVEIKERPGYVGIRAAFEVQSAAMREGFALSHANQTLESVLEDIRSKARAYRSQPSLAADKILSIVVKATFADGTHKTTMFGAVVSEIIVPMWAYDLTNQTLGDLLASKCAAWICADVRTGRDTKYLVRLAKARFKIEGEMNVLLDEITVAEMMEEAVAMAVKKGVNDEDIGSIRLLKEAGEHDERVQEFEDWLGLWQHAFCVYALFAANLAEHGPQLLAEKSFVVQLEKDEFCVDTATAFIPRPPEISGWTSNDAAVGMAARFGAPNILDFHSSFSPASQLRILIANGNFKGEWLVAAYAVDVKDILPPLWRYSLADKLLGEALEQVWLQDFDYAVPRGEHRFHLLRLIEVRFQLGGHSAVLDYRVLARMIRILK
uniref:MYND-type domain-containing protein n=1 Tax=Mycena chlorophos TaxID=658473 RepID=A0ABQ0LAX3_MYCCL|nr:predicted protein [Mycena chlorophos]